ncbi:MAG: hypothetical protein IH946_02930, partial [Bacteroidetes bacterium]|nr:hypothetical protein [Bacteroidota bacterium]
MKNKMTRMLNRSMLILLAIFFVQQLYAQQQPMPASRILLELQKFNVLGSALYIAAHPDDENTRLITYLANEEKVRAAYLSITRGDGGQNLVGTEKGPL